MRSYDPDILVAYDVQQTSFGYLIERGTVLSILVANVTNSNRNRHVQRIEQKSLQYS